MLKDPRVSVSEEVRAVEGRTEGYKLGEEVVGSKDFFFFFLRYWGLNSGPTP
jgi:hypothetical protein